jgi:transcriptional regulator with XRE-family HTH domain
MGRLQIAMAHWTDEDRPEVDVGERLRAVRQLRRATLREISERAGVSESFLSQVERSKVNASIASVQRIAAALGVSMADLFASAVRSPTRVIRRADREFVAFGEGASKAMLSPRPLEHLEMLAGVFAPGGSTGEEPYTHDDSEELLLVVSGRVEAQVGTDKFEMGPGDSIFYRSSMPHRVANVADEDAEVVWVISPPSY